MHQQHRAPHATDALPIWERVARGIDAGGRAAASHLPRRAGGRDFRMWGRRGRVRAGRHATRGGIEAGRAGAGSFSVESGRCPGRCVRTVQQPPCGGISTRSPESSGVCSTTDATLARFANQRDGADPTDWPYRTSWLAGSTPHLGGVGLQRALRE
eukprot:scaffold16094_cov124-Isochrysis_galbana.AAC.5